MQGAAVVGVEDSPGLDVGDGLLDHLADPVDALVRCCLIIFCIQVIILGIIMRLK